MPGMGAHDGRNTQEAALVEIQARVDKKILAMRPGERKQKAQEFYVTALQEIRGIKDAWRNHVMHSRTEYTALEADAIRDHVGRLMATLAKKISAA